MNNDRLHQLLKGLQTPDPSTEAREKAWYRSRIAFVNHRDQPEGNETNWRKVSILTACLLSIAIFGTMALIRSGEKKTVPDAGLAIFAQMEALFEGRLDAVLSNSGGLEIVLSTEKQQSNDQRVWAHLREGSASVNLLTYSGKSVCVELEGRTLCFEVLVSEDGGVLLVGDDFLWDSEKTAGLGPLQISAGIYTRQPEKI